jgi:hypothetical protein
MKKVKKLSVFLIVSIFISLLCVLSTKAMGLAENLERSKLEKELNYSVKSAFNRQVRDREINRKIRQTERQIKENSLILKKFEEANERLDLKLNPLLSEEKKYVKEMFLADIIRFRVLKIKLGLIKGKISHIKSMMEANNKLILKIKLKSEEWEKNLKILKNIQIYDEV